MIKKILLTLFLFIPLHSNASIPERFEEFFYSPEISSRHCGNNISHFIKYLFQKGEAVKNINVISITAPDHDWSFGRVVAVNSRWGTKIESSLHQNWSFHVVAIIDGFVYDFSFNEQPLILPLKKYMQQMFVPKSPFAINGETFRVRGQGPYYTSAHATSELAKFKFKTFSTDSRGVFTAIESEISFNDFMNKFDRSME